MSPEADLYYMRNRWYEPRTGRFLSEDPLGLAGGINGYAFSSDDPVNGADPFGLCTIYKGNTNEIVREAGEGEVVEGEDGRPIKCHNGSWSYAGGDGGGGSGGGAGGGAAPTQCRRMAHMAGDIASGVDSPQEFADLFGLRAAGVSSILPLMLGGGGQNSRSLDGGISGFLPQFEDGSGHQARHFAAAVWIAERTWTPMQRSNYNIIREIFWPSGSLADFRLTNAGYELYHALTTGLLPRSAVRQWILDNVCEN
jgi:hypothetical protein